MTKKQLIINQEKRIKKLYDILNNGKLIAVCTFDKNNKYRLFKDIIWYVPRRQTAINYGSLKDFTSQVNSGFIKAKFI